MKSLYRSILAVSVAVALSGCAATPKTNSELETARALVPQVEASPRAGVAAADISEARKALDRANQFAEKSGQLDAAKYEAEVAAKYAQIANEKIQAAQATEELERGTVQRQQVLLEARNRETQLANQQAQFANQRAAGSQERADNMEERAESLEQQLKDLKGKKTERGLVLTLGDVLFDSGKATLKPGAYSTLDRLATTLKEAPGRRVAIEGHTDSLGSDSFNQSLSQLRAASVQSALIERGVNGTQISALGKGEGFPIATNDDAAGRQQNRRVELIFTEASERVSAETD